MFSQIYFLSFMLQISTTKEWDKTPFPEDDFVKLLRYLKACEYVDKEHSLVVFVSDDMLSKYRKALRNEHYVKLQTVIICSDEAPASLKSSFSSWAVQHVLICSSSSSHTSLAFSEEDERLKVRVKQYI